MTREDAVVTAKFSEKHAVVAAVEALADSGVPVRSIELVLVDERGFHRRAVSVRRELGLTRGITFGLAAGAVLGAGLAALAAFANTQAGPLPSSAVAMAAARGAGAGAGAGGPLGAIYGMGRWRGRVGLSDADVAGGAVLLSVRGEQLVERASSILAGAGATNLAE